jgi:hypothetical protein
MTETKWVSLRDRVVPVFLDATLDPDGQDDRWHVQVEGTGEVLPFGIPTYDTEAEAVVACVQENKRACKGFDQQAKEALRLAREADDVIYAMETRLKVLREEAT